jgi:lipopolysaccharide/colanic/teichoic acid biosynthesis glycosyltransferase
VVLALEERRNALPLADLLRVRTTGVQVGALLIRLESPGSSFFRQRRVGLSNQPFDILKLRSMRQDAEVDGQAVWAAKADPRVTRIGRFIRKVRIDELPEAWTVLKGEMSFVGPRPERPKFVDQLEEHVPFYAEGHRVKPGLTGWARINYPAALRSRMHGTSWNSISTTRKTVRLSSNCGPCCGRSRWYCGRAARAEMALR